MDAMSNPSLDEASKVGTHGAAKALIKGLALVELVAVAGPMRLADLVEQSGLPRPTALRLLEALRDHEVVQLTSSGTYVLGPRLAVWGQPYMEGLDLRAQAEDIIDSLASETRETCFLGVRDGNQVLYVAKADSPQAVSPAARVGSRNPLHSTSIGKALLAFGPEQLIEPYLQEPLVAKTPNTVTDPQRILHRRRRERGRGAMRGRTGARPHRIHGGRDISLCAGLPLRSRGPAASGAARHGRRAGAIAPDRVSFPGSGHRTVQLR